MFLGECIFGDKPKKPAQRSTGTDQIHEDLRYGTGTLLNCANKQGNSGATRRKGCLRIHLYFMQ